MRPDSIEPFHQVDGDKDRICTDKIGRLYHARQCGKQGQGSLYTGICIAW